MIGIWWESRSGRVTSLMGGHKASILDLGDHMEITILEKPKEGK